MRSSTTSMGQDSKRMAGVNSSWTEFCRPSASQPRFAESRSVRSAIARSRDLPPGQGWAAPRLRAGGMTRTALGRPSGQ